MSLFACSLENDLDFLRWNPRVFRARRCRNCSGGIPVKACVLEIDEPATLLNMVSRSNQMLSQNALS